MKLMEIINMQKVGCLVLAVASLLWNVSAFSGTTTGLVNEIYVHYNHDRLLFSMTSSDPMFTACATTKRYVVSTSSQQGKNVLSAVLAAKAAQQEITVVGLNTCNVHQDSETVQYLIVR